jgi:apolipoprotein D and lipocalin family protein
MKLKILTLSFLLAGLSMGCTEPPKGITPISQFDIKRYQGKWYEIMRLDHRFERGLSNVTATYTPQENGSIEVVNRGLDQESCKWKEAKGTATFLGAKTIASLSVTFFWPFSGGYHIIALDKKDYQYALVSGPSRDYLWILARNASLKPNIKKKLISIAQENGFNTRELILVNQAKSFCDKKTS